MIVVKKKPKRSLIIVILAAILAVLTALAIILDTVLLIDTPDEGTSVVPPVVDKTIGEDIYLSSAIAYARADEAHINSIRIYGKGEYGFDRMDIDKDPSTESPFVFNYRDKNGNLQVYLPDIMYEDGGFEYNDLYALEQNDGYGTIMKLTYLTTAFGTLYFDSRLDLSENEAERKKELSAFGFGEEDSPITVEIKYNVHTGGSDHDGETEVTHTVKVGSKLATNSGYYYMVDDRPYVYTTYTAYIDYAFIEFTDYINPILVAAGLPQDNAFEPYLTTDYQQYKNTVYDYKDGEYSHKVAAGSEVVVGATVTKPDGSQFKKEGYGDTVFVKGGLVTESRADVVFNLGKYSTNEWKSISDALTSLNTGRLGSPIVITVPEYSGVVDIAAGIEYGYKIKSIEAIITDGGYDAPAGAVVESTSSVKVTYEVYKNGVAAFESALWGIVDLSSDKTPEAVKAALLGKSVGSTLSDETYKIVYTSENSLEKPYRVIVERIIGISDEEGNLPETAVDGAKVLYRYDVYVNNELLYNDMIGEVVIGAEGQSDFNKLLSNSFKGKKIGDLRVEYNSTISLEFISSFSTFEIDEIKYFVVKEKVVSFKFQQASERDPYYGESIYMNTTGGKYALYALNASSCEAVVKILGGLLTNASSSTGLVGTRTVDVNITPQKLKDYGLYANTLYFELPRGIEAKVYDSTTTTMEQYLTNLDDYEYATTLGFNLYISDADPATGKRYIASDLYDVIAEIDVGDSFVFLEQSFIDFYARKNAVLVNIENIASINLEFMMEDKYGTYFNELRHQQTYSYGGRLYLKSQLTAEQLEAASPYDSIEVIVTPSGECNETELSKFLAEHGYSFVSFRELYGKDKTDRMDSLGTSYFKEFVQTLFYTRYQGTLTEEEQANALSGGELVSRMTIKLVENDQNPPKYHYVYEFYKISSRRVMVRISQIARDGKAVYSVSDFYVSGFAFKKLCSKYFDLLNARDVDNETVFKEELVN